MVKDIFMPIMGSSRAGSTCRETVTTAMRNRWGNFVQAIISFVLVGFCLFLVVKGMNRLKDTGWMEPAPPPDPTATEKLLVEIRDLMKKQAEEKPAADSPPVPT